MAALDVFRIGLHVLKTTISGTAKTVLAQLGNVAGAGVPESDTAEWWQHDGFMSLPPTATPGASASETVTISRGGRDVVIASRDLRGQQLAGSMQPGETCLYAAGADGKGQSRILLKANGSINLYTRKGNTDSGGGLALMLDPSTDQITMVNSQGYGIIIDSTGVKLTSKGAGLTLTSEGNATLVGKGKTQVDGGGVVIGSNAVTGINSALTGVTGVSGKASVKCLIE